MTVDSTNKTNLRAIVLEILIQSENETTLTGMLIHDVLKRYAYLSARDRAFIKNLAEGTVERRITLDYIINSFSKVKTNKMKNVVREVLRMSTYQIYFMTRVPQSAVCNEAVKLIRKKHMNGLTGFVNGVLRSIASNRIDLATIENLSVKYSMPEWIVKRFESEFGTEKAEKILQASIGSRPVYIRTNVSRIKPSELKVMLEDEGVNVKSVEGREYAFEISGFDRLGSLQSFNDGLFSVQDLSSMSVGELASPQEGMYVIDMCAAPGGKTCHAAELMMGTGIVDSRDVSDKKTELIVENKERLALKNIKISVKDATVFDAESKEKADIVIADLPCSGLGVIGRKNDLKYRVKPEDIDELAALQKVILKNAVQYVKPGGKLVFSTCTITKEETTDQARYLEEVLGLRRGEERKFLPDVNGSDGFYAIEMLKNK